MSVEGMAVIVTLVMLLQDVSDFRGGWFFNQEAK